MKLVILINKVFTLGSSEQTTKKFNKIYKEPIVLLQTTSLVVSDLFRLAAFFCELRNVKNKVFHFVWGPVSEVPPQNK